MNRAFLLLLLPAAAWAGSLAQLRQACGHLVAHTPIRTQSLWGGTNQPYPTWRGGAPKTPDLLMMMPGVMEHLAPGFDRSTRDATREDWIVANLGVRLDHLPTDDLPEEEPSLTKIVAPMLQATQTTTMDAVAVALRMLRYLIPKTSWALPVGIIERVERALQRIETADWMTVETRLSVREVRRLCRTERWNRLAFWTRHLTTHAFGHTEAKKMSEDFSDLLLDSDRGLAAQTFELFERQWTENADENLLFLLMEALDRAIDRQETAMGMPTDTMRGARAQVSSDLRSLFPSRPYAVDNRSEQRRLRLLRRLYGSYVSLQSSRLLRLLQREMLQLTVLQLGNFGTELWKATEGTLSLIPTEGLAFLDAKIAAQDPSFFAWVVVPESADGTESARTPLGDAHFRRVLQEADLEPEAAEGVGRMLALEHLIVALRATQPGPGQRFAQRILLAYAQRLPAQP